MPWVGSNTSLCSSSDLLSRNYGAARSTGQNKTDCHRSSISKIGQGERPPSSLQLQDSHAHHTHKHMHAGNSLAVQWLGHRASTVGGTGSIPGQGTKILHAVQCGQNKTKHMHAHLHTTHTYTRVHTYIAHTHTHTRACTHSRKPQTKKMRTENAYSWKASF